MRWFGFFGIAFAAVACSSFGSGDGSSSSQPPADASVPPTTDDGGSGVDGSFPPDAAAAPDAGGPIFTTTFDDTTDLAQWTLAPLNDGVVTADVKTNVGTNNSAGLYVKVNPTTNTSYGYLSRPVSTVGATEVRYSLDLEITDLLDGTNGPSVVIASIAWPGDHNVNLVYEIGKLRVVNEESSVVQSGTGTFLPMPNTFHHYTIVVQGLGDSQPTIHLEADGAKTTGGTMTATPPGSPVLRVGAVEVNPQITAGPGYAIDNVSFAVK